MSVLNSILTVWVLGLAVPQVVDNCTFALKQNPPNNVTFCISIQSAGGCSWLKNWTIELYSARFASSTGGEWLYKLLCLFLSECSLSCRAWLLGKGDFDTTVFEVFVDDCVAFVNIGIFDYLFTVLLFEVA